MKGKPEWDPELGKSTSPLGGRIERFWPTVIAERRVKATGRISDCFMR
jgi:hypothetical protein